jgi:hypothetical protein
VFSFNLNSGEIKYTGNEYRVPSPNFICSCPIADRYSEEEDNDVLVEVANGNLVPTGRTNMDTVVNDIIPATVEFDSAQKNALDLQLELEHARKEIDELKKQISVLSTPNTSPETTLTTDEAHDLKGFLAHQLKVAKLEGA